MAEKLNVTPLHDRLIIKPAPAEEKTAGGIIIPETAKEKPARGTVVAAGAGKGNIVLMLSKDLLKPVLIATCIAIPIGYYVVRWLDFTQASWLISAMTALITFAIALFLVSIKAKIDEPVTVKVGDNVLYGKYAGTEISVDGRDYLIMRESDVLAII